MNLESIIRFGFFFGLFATFALVEFLFPKRPLTEKKLYRWANNIGLIVLDNLFVKFAIPLVPAFFADQAALEGIGLFNSISLPLWSTIFLTVIVMDLIIYFQHLLFHKVPFLWALHKVHHIDSDIDVTTALRFHPIEIALSLGIKIGCVYLFGFSALGIMIFEIILNGAAMFNHANIGLPKKLDAFIRLFIVTPDMHRVHHSVIFEETNSNYGFNLSIWDRIFGTYIEEPQKGHDAMDIGLEEFSDRKYQLLHWMLIEPFISGEKKNE